MTDLHHLGPAEPDRLHYILDSLVAFVALLTPEGRLKDVSRNALEAGGVQFADVENRLFWECTWYTHDSVAAARMKDAVERAARGETSRYDEVVRTIGDGRLDIDVQIAPVRDTSGAVIEIVASATDISARVAGQRQTQALMADMSHRIKNILSTVRALARMTRRTARSESAFDDFIGRVDALTALHDALNRTREADEFFVELAESVLAPYLADRRSRFSIRGPHRTLQRDQAKLLGLCINELATNAAKYGALSTPDGRVDVELRAEGGTATFAWRETGVPGTTEPTHKGFGTLFVSETLGSIFDAAASRQYGADGLTVTVTGTDARLFATASPGAAA
ncbi:sensor histidine kinase [Wenxinia marina]|uniref:histidine kinase n=1 Tax=Wenxinia marina DSM 24838 TaxID=1123501 RepID=A0A0D0NLE8_9RHOB|nr:HWE histidine kinase domain-containing protein [Wenxinia marina]KIQ69120.1 PAS domain S-box [Wenxinia marina DSM 24838]GGL70393.1 hypothetical protein GCM10011392_26300 [Wenxinia marina]